MWADLLKALGAVVAFVLFPFAVIAVTAEAVAFFSHFTAGHRHQH
jgi:hypothetical protein